MPLSRQALWEVLQKPLKVYLELFLGAKS